MSERPSYKTEAYESPARLPPELTTSAGNGAAAVTNSPLVKSPPHLIKGIEEQSHSLGETATIVKAGGAVLRMLMQQIAFHDGEAEKLRSVLRQFAQASGAKHENVQGSVSDDDMTFLRNVLEKSK
jgi:hypothetical protein